MTAKPKSRPIPSKPIERAHILIPGDRAAGLRDQSFMAEVWIDPSTVGDDTFWGWLAIIRHKISAAWEEMLGEKPGVMFDFEVEEQTAREKACRRVVEGTAKMASSAPPEVREALGAVAHDVLKQRLD